MEKEKIIGNFKPKRKFLNFVLASNLNYKTRIISNSAFIKGEVLSGILSDIIFKVTICDEGTINFEEIGSNKVNEEQIKRLIEDIDTLDISIYSGKFIVKGVAFTDEKNNILYLEVEHQKPIDILLSIIDDEKVPVISEKGLDFLDSLFGENVDDEVVKIEEKECKNDKPINIKSKSYLEDSFNKIRDNNINELKERIESCKLNISKYKNDISLLQKGLEKSIRDFNILEDRLDSYNIIDPPNGYVFFVSELIISDVEPDVNTVKIVDKISNIANLNKDVILKLITDGYYTISISYKNNIGSEDKIPNDIYNLIYSIDVEGQILNVGINKFEYRGKLNWHQIISKMIKLGFEQSPEFNKICLSNSYFSNNN